MSATIESAKPPVSAVLRAGAIATVVAIVVNAVLYFVSNLLGWFPETVLNPMGQPITLVPVAMLTLFAGIVATAGYLVLTRFLAKGRADTVFLILAALVLIAMATTPFQLPGAPAMMIVVLEIMHLVAGGAPVYYLTRTT